MSRGGYYAVANGRNTGVYDSWDQCSEQVNGYSGASFKKFSSFEDATAFVSGSSDRNGGSSSYRSNHGGSQSSSYYHGSRSSGNSYAPSVQRSSSDNYRSDWDTAPIVYTDGACSNNGRSGAQAGYGVNWGPGHRDNCHGPVDGRQTSNRGELKAVDRALEQALDRGYDRVTVRTDSKLTKDSLDTWKDDWKRNNWTKSNGEPVKNTDLIRGIDDKMSKMQVRIEHVKGHSGNRGNEDADRMARMGASYKY